nr:MAG TPA: hypothetical protein [Caudoviricetes sp.]
MAADPKRVHRKRPHSREQAPPYRVLTPLPHIVNTPTSQKKLNFQNYKKFPEENERKSTLFTGGIPRNDLLK